MFPTLGLFAKLPCPEKPNCRRISCVYSHDPRVMPPPIIQIPVEKSAIVDTGPNSVLSSSITKPRQSVVPAKRPLPLSVPSAASSSKVSLVKEPPLKLQRAGPVQTPSAIPTRIQTNNDGVPILKINAAQSQVALAIRQKMLKNIYDHFSVLYQNLLNTFPELAAEDSLRQEEDVYNKSTKLTYRNAGINAIASIKRRPLPDSKSHPSVGTVAEVVKREEDKKKLAALRLTKSQLERHVLSLDQMRQTGYIVEIPSGVGGERPSEEGSVKTCERCSKPFKVKRMEEADECVFHYGRVRTIRENGEKTKIYTCCSRSTEIEGCDRGPHVFYESDPEDLHRRHGFSFTRPPISAEYPGPNGNTEDTAYDIVALDCEMVYSTGGMRVARVSIVDGSGKEIFDEIIRMDDGVDVIDFNTRFSGITPENYATAVLPLVSIRKALDGLINSDTIIIGHALDNDLKTLRMIHHRCVDTASLYPHKFGPPYKRALRDLSKEHLGITIQTGGGTVGHSSLEDSIATLDLVRYFILNNPKPPVTTAITTTS